MTAEPWSLAGSIVLLGALFTQTAASNAQAPALMEITATPNTPGTWSGFVIRYNDINGDRKFDFNELSFFSGATLIQSWGTYNYTGIRLVPTVEEVSNCGGWSSSDCRRWGFWYWEPPRYTVSEFVFHDVFSYVVVEVPENSTWAMMLAGLAGIALVGRAARRGGASEAASPEN